MKHQKRLLLILPALLTIGACAENVDDLDGVERASIMKEAMHDFLDCAAQVELSEVVEQTEAIRVTEFSVDQNDTCRDERDAALDALDALDELGLDEGFRASATIRCSWVPGVDLIWECRSPGGSCIGYDYQSCTCRDYEGNIISHHECAQQPWENNQIM